MCYITGKMEQTSASANGSHPRHLSRYLALLTLTAVTILTLVGCPTVTPVRVPEFDTSVGALNFQIGTAIAEVELPFARGGSGELTYSLGPELPPGLSFDGQTRTLRGTPTVAGEYELVYTVRDVNGR